MIHMKTLYIDCFAGIAGVSSVVSKLVRENSHDIPRNASGSARPYIIAREVMPAGREAPTLEKVIDPFEELLSCTRKK